MTDIPMHKMDQAAFIGEVRRRASDDRYRVPNLAVRRLLAALDAVLKHHQPRQLYDMAVSFNGKPLCAHGPDYDGDRHFEADDGIWYCKDKPTVKVCISCTDGPGGDSWAEWPCPTYSVIIRELNGEEKTGG